MLENVPGFDPNRRGPGREAVAPAERRLILDEVIFNLICCVQEGTRKTFLPPYVIFTALKACKLSHSVYVIGRNATVNSR
jgi:hypothetical protein